MKIQFLKAAKNMHFSRWTVRLFPQANKIRVIYDSVYLKLFISMPDNERTTLYCHKSHDSITCDNCWVYHESSQYNATCKAHEEASTCL